MALKAAGKAVIAANQKRRTMEGITKILLDAMENETSEADVIEQVGDEKITKIGELLFKLGCLMRKKDIEEEKSKTKSADALVAKLKAKAKEKPKTSVAKALNKGMISWLTKHGGSKKRYAATSSKKCDAKGYGTGYEASGLVKGLTAVAKGVAAVGSVAVDIACGLNEMNGGPACGIGGSSTKGAKEEKKKEGAPKKDAAKKKNNRLREEMPAYLLNAITKEKPAHPKYGKLRY
jgi:hypothetical protein